MCNHHENFNPVRCIIPPYISEKLADSGNKNVATTVKLRAKREFVGGLTTSQALLLHPAKPQKKAAKLNMQVYDMKHGTNTSAAKLIWDNGTPKGKQDTDAKNVVAAGSATWDFYYKIYGRNSV